MKNICGLVASAFICPLQTFSLNSKLEFNSCLRSPVGCLIHTSCSSCPANILICSLTPSAHSRPGVCWWHILSFLFLMPKTIASSLPHSFLHLISKPLSSKICYFSVCPQLPTLAISFSPLITAAASNCPTCVHHWHIWQQIHHHMAFPTWSGACHFSGRASHGSRAGSVPKQALHDPVPFPWSPCSSRMGLLLSLLRSRHSCLGVSSLVPALCQMLFPLMSRQFPSSPPQTPPPGGLPWPPHVKLKLPPLPNTFSFLSFSTALIPLNTVCSVFKCLTYSFSPFRI